MQQRRFAAAAIAAAVLLSMAAGCTSDKPDDPGTKGGSGKPVVAFSQEGLENDWRTENTQSIISSLEAAGYEVIYQQADEDQARQVEQVQNMLQQKPDILVVEPAEAEAATPIARLAQEAGIPLIVADRSLGVEPGGEFTMYKTVITQNWEDMGTKLGEAAVALLTKLNGAPKGNIVEIIGTLGSSPQINMDKGFAAVIAKYPDIKIIAAEDGDNKRAEGMQIMEDFLTRFPAGGIDMVWSHNDEMALGALMAIEAAGRTELLGTIISKDGKVEAIEQVAKGVFANVCTNTPYFGPIILPYVQDILAGKEVPTHPDKPFACFESITDAGLAEAKTQYNDLVAANAKFANR
ncbi:MAG: substrate-binding domain-containing protein [Propionibacteriaceae bacterium]|nr:substrate-binding domain-containing protein [Propionibacteriaceae bacterium]